MTQWVAAMMGKKFGMTLYVALNLLFILKYGSRLGATVVCLLSGAWMAWVVLLCWVLNHVQRAQRVLMVFCVVALVSLFVAQGLIDPYQIKVDRWSAIDHHLAYLLQGRYPYAAQTHLGGYGSPFPVWQWLHLPFHLLGNVGLSSLACMGLYLHSLCRWRGVRTALSAGVLMVGSPAVCYEVVVRSDLMDNFMMVAAIVQYLIYYKVSLSRHLFGCAVLCGLMLSTRMSTAIPLFIFFLGQYVVLSWRKQLVFPLGVVLVFALTFVPYLLWSSDLFLFEYNPFVLQTSMSRPSDALLLAPLVLAAAWWARGTEERYFASVALCLLAGVVVVFVHNMWIESNFTSLFTSRYDITYIDMSLPFLFTAIALQFDKKNDGLS